MSKLEDLRSDLTLLAQQYLALSVVVNLLIKKTGINNEEYEEALKDAIGKHLEGQLVRPTGTGTTSSDPEQQQPELSGTASLRADPDAPESSSESPVSDKSNSYGYP